jgi:hypothetical protein
MTTPNSNKVFTGSGGKVTYATAATGANLNASPDDVLLARITNWTLTTTCSTSAWGDSDSRGFTNRTPARKDATGSMTGKADVDLPLHGIMMPHDVKGIVLWQDGDDGTGLGEDSVYWELPRAVITNYTLSFDQDSKEVVEWSADFECDGVYFYPGDADNTGIGSHSLPDPE